ncbi:DUF5691 domain-containing protein [Methylobacterium organophilum]|uniref:DUF5691 domain-containing protein n=1 Tax=Methylobacterium organophilum TaxID=410 RepID=UPI001F13C02D|nr:DUF5691 domain-containing protein [Methylobacterium organophilum]UMY19651.1 DUF5691 domain-containing protein [Methylobacterium organophilum]
MGAVPVADGFEAALAAALIGAERAPPALLDDAFPGLAPEADSGGRLLARLAAQGLHHLAGRGLAAEALAPLPPREAAGPECPPAAAARLALLLAGGRTARPRLAEWCALAGAAGVRAPIWLLPALIPYRSDWPEALDRIAGPEIAWFRQACGGEASPAAGRDWTEGTTEERRAAFAAFRQRDPEGARAALEAGFRAEKAEMRHALVSILEIGLSEADEPFLEACLDDRSSGVRAAAQGLLPRLPRSRLAARMGARARAALVLESKRRLLGGTKHALVVTLPEESPALARDGVEPNAYERRGGGTRAGLLRDILARAPLHVFAEHPPRLWIELGLHSEFAEAIFEGFFASVRRERDPDWVRAQAAVLGEAYAGRLSGIRPTNPLRERWARTVALLPAEEWERTVAAALPHGAIEDAFALLVTGPPVFSERFGAACLDWLAAVTRGSRADRDGLAKTWLLDRLGERIVPTEDAAAAAAAILARLPEGEDHRLHGQLAAFAETLALRVALRRDFA